MNDQIPLAQYNTDICSKRHTKIAVWDLVLNYTYLGIHTEAELDAQYGTN